MSNILQSGRLYTPSENDNYIDQGLSNRGPGTAGVKPQSGEKKVEFKIGEYVLLHRIAYHNTGRYWKLQPFFVGPFQVVKKINENAYELDLPIITKKHRVFNIKWLKKFIARGELYYERPPMTKGRD